MELGIEGSGKPLVLVHSLLADSSAFDLIAPALSRHRRLVRPSLPGYGATPRSIAPIETVARDLAAMLEASSIAAPFDLLGNGYGGFVALSLAQQYPDRVDHLVLLDSAAAFPEPGKEAIRVMKRAAEARGIEAVVEIALQRLFPAAFTATAPEIVSRCRESLLRFDSVAFASTCQNLIDVDLRGGLARVSARTLVVVGLEDRATPLELARVVADGISGARLVEIEGCGHAPQLQFPERVIALLEGFLADAA